MKRSAWLLIVILIAGLGAAGVWFYRGPADSGETVTVAYGKILDRIAARGKVEAKTTVDLASKLDGRIQAIAAEEGQFVKQDQVIITLEDEYAKATVAQARAELKDAQLKHARSRRLFQSRSIAKAELDEAEVRLDRARAELDRATALLNDMYIASPISGKVITKYREAGESVKAGVPILTVADASSLRVRAEIDEDDVGGLALGQEAEISADAYPGRVFTGKVIEIGERVGKRSIKPEDPSKITDTKVLETKIELPSETPFKLGMTVDVKIDVVRKDHVLKIPRKAIRQDSSGSYVMVAKDGRREVRRVVPGALDPWDAEIVQGLREQEKVVMP